MKTRFAMLVGALLLSACGSQHLHVIQDGAPAAAPQYVDLRSEFSVATLHFPAGVYALDATDDAGNYYRAPGKIVQHTSASPVLRDGGIYVNKRNPRKLRGYVYLAGKLTHVGNLSGAKYELRN